MNATHFRGGNLSILIGFFVCLLEANSRLLSVLLSAKEKCLWVTRKQMPLNPIKPHEQHLSHWMLLSNIVFHPPVPLQPQPRLKISKPRRIQQVYDAQAKERYTKNSAYLCTGSIWMRKIIYTYLLQWDMSQIFMIMGISSSHISKFR